jgi:hypothetical protein
MESCNIMQNCNIRVILDIAFSASSQKHFVTSPLLHGRSSTSQLKKLEEKNPCKYVLERMLSNGISKPTINSISHEHQSKVVSCKPRSFYIVLYFSHLHRNVSLLRIEAIESSRRHLAHWRLITSI